MHVVAAGGRARPGSTRASRAASRPTSGSRSSSGSTSACWRDRLLVTKIVERDAHLQRGDARSTRSLPSRARRAWRTPRATSATPSGPLRDPRRQVSPGRRARSRGGHLRARPRRDGAERREHLRGAHGGHRRADDAPVRLPDDPAGAVVPLLSEANRRKRNLLIIAGFLLLVGTANLLDIGVYAPDLPLASNIVVFALFNLNLIVLLLLVLLLFRNLVKLWFERRQSVIGARFKAKLVLAFLALSLIPAMLIFLIASNFINKSIEGWFKPQVERPLDQALAVAQTYYANLERTALRHAQHIGRVIDRDGLLAEDAPRGAGRLPRRAAGPARAQRDHRLRRRRDRSWSTSRIRSWAISRPATSTRASCARALAGQERHHRARAARPGDLIEAVAPIWSTATASAASWASVVVGTHVTGAPRGARARHLAGVPGVQAAQAAEEPDQGHLHPALPAHDPDRRLLVHVVRPLPGPRDHRPHRAAGRGHARGRGRQPRLQGARRAATTRSASSSSRSTA